MLCPCAGSRYRAWRYPVTPVGGGVAGVPTPTLNDAFFVLAVPVVRVVSSIVRVCASRATTIRCVNG